ncbi:uncharacterized protein N7479_010446 [Penicillium vulpinum]|uniref:uncharacterized protein n=1 Tax=Penicillium vulpinum TaxID=29845 RepID=UPI002548469B|nr:uncharacterized protein N7479_010446 [Penicillium vulpinum]KAJ5952033.1 hypothetical protein N7479_010446 [Penicillium vulpinum]
MNDIARLAIDTEHHKKFTKGAAFENRPTRYFELSLTTLSEHVELGWEICSARQDQAIGNPSAWVLWIYEDEGGTTAARGTIRSLAFMLEAGGFFLIADNKRRKMMTNGEIFRTDRRLIRPKNTIMIGNVFSLHPSMSEGKPVIEPLIFGNFI